MNSLLIWTPVATIVFGLLLWLLVSQRGQAAGGDPARDGMLDMPYPVHYRYFPQIRQALAESDEHYLRQNASPQIARRALRERRMVARSFLSGLLEDFSNLERLARTVAALSPKISREQEVERLVLGAKFRLLYAVVWVRLSVGRIPLHNLEHLAGLVGRLGTRMEEAMASVNALSRLGLTDHFSV